MQCGAGDGGSREPDRFQDRLRGQDAGPPHLYHNVHQFRLLLFRRILEGYRPFGEFRRGTQGRAVRKGVDFNHRAVNVKGIVRPLLLYPFNLRLHRLRSRQGPAGNDLEMLGSQIVQRLRVGGKCSALRKLQVENLNVQFPFGGQFWIFLPQGTGGGVARIGQRRLSLQFQRGVKLREHAPGHIDLSPDNQTGQRIRQTHRNRADCPQILRHVFSHTPVSSGSAFVKYAVPVFQRHGQTVHFGFHGVFRAFFQRFFHPLAKVRCLLPVEHILQTLQRHFVRVGLESPQDFVSDALGRGIRRHFLRVRRLQLFQTPVEQVIFVVVHGGRVQHIVFVAVLVQHFPQTPDFCPVIHRFVHLLPPYSRISAPSAAWTEEPYLLSIYPLFRT